MSTRANVIIKDEDTAIYFYRHSDGYPECTGESLKKFVAGYSNQYRMDVMQSAGWLIVHGQNEYSDMGDSYGWKVGAYEPTDRLHGDVDYIWVIDLKAKQLLCYEPKDGFWDNPSAENTMPCKEFKPYAIKVQK